jgi:hypothetical protein
VSCSSSTKCSVQEFLRVTSWQVSGFDALFAGRGRNYRKGRISVRLSSYDNVRKHWTGFDYILYWCESPVNIVGGFIFVSVWYNLVPALQKLKSDLIDFLQTRYYKMQAIKQAYKYYWDLQVVFVTFLNVVII